MSERDMDSLDKTISLLERIEQSIPLHPYSNRICSLQYQVKINLETAIKKLEKIKEAKQKWENYQQGGRHEH